MAKLKLNFPNRPIGARIMIPGIKGVFENGGEYELDQLSEDLALPVGSNEGAISDNKLGTDNSTNNEGDDE